MKATPFVFGMVMTIVVFICGCKSPMEQALEDELHQRLHFSSRRYLEALGPDKVIEVDRPRNQVEANLKPERRQELNAMSGPTAYEEQKPDMGVDLLDQTDTPTVAMSLRRIIKLAVKHNLELQQARLIPAINQTQIIQAEAVFDAIVFADVNFQNLDTPRPSVALAGGITSPFGATRTEDTIYNVGIRKLLQTGGQLTFGTSITRNDERPSFFVDETFYSSNLFVTLTQPLLRNFGSDVNRSQIELSASARRQSLQDLHRTTMDVVFAAEQAYWTIAFARHRLLIQQRLLQRTIKDRDIIVNRKDFDATEAQVAEANNFVQSQTAGVIRARQDVRRRSDALKRLISSEDLPLSAETLIVPLDVPADVPIKFSLLDAVTTAWQHRPEVKRALLGIKDASIRQRVADNQRLPVLDLTVTIRYNGIGDKPHYSLDRSIEGEFIDYIIGFQFEMPLGGDRRRKAEYRQRRLERQAAVIAYQREARDVVLEVKNALRNLADQYELIDAERGARLAAAEFVRALKVQQDLQADLTPEFIDLKLRRQEALAAAEVREFQALVDYNTAIAELYRAMGTLLEHNGIDLIDPLDER